MVQEGAVTEALSVYGETNVDVQFKFDEDYDNIFHGQTLCDCKIYTHHVFSLWI